MSTQTAENGTKHVSTAPVSISVITPTFNSGKTFRKTIESVLNQTKAPCEYIVVDGASTDDTLQILEEYREQFEKKGIDLRILSEKDNGIYDAMNKGTQMAKGDIVGIINSDDWYETNALETVARTYETQPFDLFYADLRIWTEGPDGELKEKLVKHSRLRTPVVSRDWNHPTTFLTREMYGIYQYKCESLHDDWELILRMRKDNRKVVVVNEVLANFRMNGVSHEKSLGKAVARGKARYKAYVDNGYSKFYFFECIAIELAKWIAG